MVEAWFCKAYLQPLALVVSVSVTLSLPCSLPLLHLHVETDCPQLRAWYVFSAPERLVLNVKLNSGKVERGAMKLVNPLPSISGICFNILLHTRGGTRCG